MSDQPEGPDLLADRIAGLSPAKRALLEMRLKQKRAGVASEIAGPLPPIPLRANRESAPLSFAQQRLWFLDQLDPGSALYNMPRQIRTTGALDDSALEQALSALVARHESLRTTFPTVDGQPVQLVAPPTPIRLPLVDLQEIPVPQRESEARRYALQEAHRPFDLARGPLFRARLLRLEAEEHVLLLTLHHIVSDGWSMDVLFRELGVLYEAFSTGTDASLPELPIQYADYAAWQRDQLQGQVLEAQLSYWRNQFRTELVPLQLPSNRPSSLRDTHEGAQLSFFLSAELSGRLGQLSRQEGATLFMTLLAAFKALLWRYTGQDNVVVASPIAGRTRPEVEGLIGFFVNLLALRTNLSGDPSFRVLLRRVKEVTLGGLAHQDLPFERLVEELQPERGLGRNPLVQVMFALQNVPHSERRLAGLSLRQIRAEKGLAKFDLGLILKEDGGTLRGLLRYNTDLFEAETIARLAKHYQTLVEAAAADPDQPISMLPLLTDGERSQLLVERNATSRDFPRDRCLHELFEEQAARVPSTPAVVSRECQLTYDGLNRRANRLAHRLRALGVGPESRVGLCTEHSVEFIVGLLGILKAGGSYVPLDPSYPAERLAFMLRDADIHLVVGPAELLRGDLRRRLPSSVRELVQLGADEEWETQGLDHNAASAVVPENAAYVMYTSGSTGEPKGVVVPHRAVVNFCVAAAADYGLTEDDRVLQFSSLSSDISVDELFPTWRSGACVVLRDPGPYAGAELEQDVERHQVTVLSLPTAFWHAWVQELHQTKQPVPQSLRLVVVGGERVQPAVFAKWLEVRGSGPIRWLNTYGPTETTVEATLYEPPPQFVGQDAAADLPIGRPIANVRAYVLDRRQEPVPVGVAGELLIGGSGVTRGYLNQPALTATKFIPDPFATDPGGRLFRTGDLVRYRPDGTLEFVGRSDRQVKIRGFRVELGEIEAVLGQHSAVRSLLVTAREDLPGGARLVAYVVPAGSAPGIVEELSRLARRRLPEQMVPEAFVLLEALPLTPNGKIDQKSLPAPEAKRPELTQAYQVPRSPVEKTIADIWSAVLNVERAGVHDNFFELGGHSLLATQVVARMRTAFGVALPLRALFEAPTIAGLAERVEAINRLLQEVASLSPDETHVELSAHEPALIDPRQTGERSA